MGEQHCQGHVDGWHNHCTRPVSEVIEGKHLCKPHAAGARRSLAVAAQNREKWLAKETQRAECQHMADTLSGLLGTKVQAHYISYDNGGAYDAQRMVVPTAWLQALATSNA